MRDKWQLIAVCAVILLMLGVWTLQRNRVYRSQVTLWEDNFRKSPNRARVCVNLAYAYKLAGQDELGVAALTRAFKLNPQLPLYFAAEKFAAEHGGRLVVEKDVWNR
jgi:hypothetical protein